MATSALNRVPAPLCPLPSATQVFPLHSQSDAFCNLQLRFRYFLRSCCNASGNPSCNPAKQECCCTDAFMHVPHIPLEVQTGLSLQYCALFFGNFPGSSRGTAETETLLGQPQEQHRPTKKKKVSRSGVVSPVSSHTLPKCYLSQLYLMMGST